MKKINILALLLLLLCTGAFAQNNFFRPVSVSQIPQARAAAKQISKKSFYQLNEPAMRNYLRNAKMEFRNNGITLPLEIPLPDGTTEIFNMVESPILSPAVAAANPSIKTYTGNGTRDKKSVIRVSLTSLGFSAIILDVGGDAVYFEPYSKETPDIYFNYFAKDAVVPAGKKLNGRCGVDDSQLGKKPSLNKGSNSQKNSGGILRTFRIAVAANGEFTAVHGGQANAFAVVANYVNNMTAVYRNELSVSFVLVSGTNIIYTNSGTDPYDNSNQTAMLTQNQNNLDLVIGSANYDVGHVWGFEGSSGGGIASLESVCDASIKGKGVSGEGEAPYAQVFNDQLFFHEVGHQFGMTHSYNSSIPVCTTRSPGTSVEPGSGATIMSYGFTCDDDDYFSSTTTGPILNYHTVNYDQAEAYMNNPGVGYGNCYVGTATGNQPPVVIVPTAYTIPKSTPFVLTGNATDANGDALTYSWEGTNVGTMVPDGSTLTNTAQPPFFRSYAPVTSPTRIYPLLSAILDGSNYAKGDKLPSVSIATTHRLTVRDNNAGGGGVSYGSVTVTVDGNIGPFLETKNLSATYAANSSQTITWSVNGTNAATPNIKIALSADGGLTFPFVLAASTPNDGSQAVTLPNITTTTARIKVEAVGNIFFDISNVNFSISGTAASYSVTASAGPNGSITPTGVVNVASGTDQTFTITPNACYQIATVLVDGVDDKGAVKSGSYKFSNVKAAHTISATFTPVTYTITASAGANGSITPNAATSVNCGTNKTFTITPNAGYVIEEVKIDKKTSLGAVSTYTFTNVTEDHKIDVTFKCPPITLSSVITDVTCNGKLTGAINLTVTNGIAPFSYAWTSKGNYSSSSEDIGGLGAGKYSIKVTQANGCKADGSYEIKEPEKLSIVSVTAENVSCFGLNDGSITLKAKGGTLPYDATIDNANYYYLSGDHITFYDLAPGTYTPVLFDGNLCSVTYSSPLVITQPAMLSATLCYTAAKSTLNVAGTGGTEPYEYSMDGVNYKKGKGNNKDYEFSIGTGLYTIFVKDKNGCIYSKSGNTGSLASCSVSKVKLQSDLNSDVTVSDGLGLPAMKVNVTPNPSGNLFTMKMSSNNSKTVQVRVMDIQGRLLFTKMGSANDTYRFGEKFVPGTYIVEVSQGKERKTIKVVKQ